MKNKSGKTSVWLVLGAIAIIAIAVFYIYGTVKNETLPGGISSGTASSGGIAGCSQNPAITPVYSDALTGLSLSSSILNAKDTKTNALLGPISVASGIMTPSIAAGTTITPLVNASGYLNQVQSNYQVTCGAQNTQGTLYQFQNETVTIYNNAGTGTIGGLIGTTGNDTAFTTQANNKIRLVGNTYRSSGRMFVIYEISTVANVSSVTLATSAPGITVNTASVPNCYTNNLTGTPYRAAWEITTPLNNGALADFNLQTNSANGNNVGGLASLTVFNEQDAVDSLNGNLLTSGICDSNNRFYGVGGAIGTNGAATGTTLKGIRNTYFFN